jgi:hypothetical protein
MVECADDDIMDVDRSIYIYICLDHELVSKICTIVLRDNLQSQDEESLTRSSSKVLVSHILGGQQLYSFTKSGRFGTARLPLTFSLRLQQIFSGWS